MQKNIHFILKRLFLLSSIAIFTVGNLKSWAAEVSNDFRHRQVLDQNPWLGEIEASGNNSQWGLLNTRYENKDIVVPLFWARIAQDSIRLTLSDSKDDHTLIYEIKFSGEQTNGTIMNLEARDKSYIGGVERISGNFLLHIVEEINIGVKVDVALVVDSAKVTAKKYPEIKAELKWLRMFAKGVGFYEKHEYYPRPNQDIYQAAIDRLLPTKRNDILQEVQTFFLEEGISEWHKLVTEFESKLLSCPQQHQTIGGFFTWLWATDPQSYEACWKVFRAPRWSWSRDFTTIAAFGGVLTKTYSWEE